MYAVNVCLLPAELFQPPHGEDKPCEVALTPLLAYDERGHRLGYGGGYYDAYFAARPEILRVGLAYAGQAPCSFRSPATLSVASSQTEMTA